MPRFFSVPLRRNPALLLFFLSLVFYLYTLSPTLSWGDGARLQREAVTGESFILTELVQVDPPEDSLPFPRLGIAAWDHPLYVVIGNLLSRAGTFVFPGSDRLWWVNLISAVFGAGTIALVFRLGWTLSGSKKAAVAAASLLAVSHTFWWHAATPEVYTLHTFLLLAALDRCLHFLSARESGSLYASAAFFGLGLSNHYLIAIGLLTVFLLLAAFFKQNRSLRELRVPHLVYLSACFLIPFSLIPIQGIRMLKIFSLQEIFGGMAGAAFLSNLPEMSLLESFLRYLGLLFVQFSPLGAALGVLGFRQIIEDVRSARRDQKPLPMDALIIGLVFVSYTAFSIFYRVADQFAFHLTSYVFFVLAIAHGWRRAERIIRPFFLTAIVGLQVMLAPVFYSNLAMVLPTLGVDEAALGIPVVGTGVRDGLDYYINPNKHGDDTALRFGLETVNALPENALVLAHWFADLDEYVVLRFFTEVEGMRPDVEVVGFPAEDPFRLDSRFAQDLVKENIGDRPVYLASLSDTFYGTATFDKLVCIVVEGNLYRVLPEPPPGEATCLPAIE